MRLNRSITTVAVLAALGISTPAATAYQSYAVGPNPHEQVVVATPVTPQSASAVQPNPDQRVASVTPPSSSTPIVRVSSPNGGFDWGDAGIGAAGGIALSTLALVGAIPLRRRIRRPALSR